MSQLHEDHLPSSVIYFHITGDEINMEMIEMLLTEKVIIQWNSNNKRYYESKGFIYTKMKQKFEIPIEDLKETSTYKVEVRCDYCAENTQKEYRAYINQREIIQKDCCSSRKCMVAKTKEVNIATIGVESVNQLEDKKNNARLRFQTPIKEVIRLAELKGLTVVDCEGYENGKSRLKVFCNKHPELGIHDTNASNIKSQKHCCRIGGFEATGKSRKMNGQTVVQAFIDKGFIPLFKSEDYQNSAQPLPFKCPSHLEEGVQYRSYSALPYAEGCLKCAHQRTKEALSNNESDVFNYFESRGLIVLDGESYKGKDIHIACKCIHHLDEVQHKTYHGLKNTDEPCVYCRNDKSITELNRALRSSINTWRKRSEKDCGYSCVLTGSSEYEVHHTYSFNEIIKETLLKLNIDTLDYSAKDIIRIKREVIDRHNSVAGVCVHPKLHILFHQLYGKENNTPEQFEEFSKKYETGEFKEILHN